MYFCVVLCIVCFVTFPVLFGCTCVLKNCHRVATQLQLNISYQSVHHRTIQINLQPDAAVFQFIILKFIYSSTCFRPFPAHHQELNDCSGSLWVYLHIEVTAVLCSWSGRLYIYKYIYTYIYISICRYEGKTRGCHCSH